MAEKIFVTGATGFVGTKLVHFLLKKNAEVTVYVRDVERTKQIYPQAHNLNIVQGDYATMDVFEREVTGHTRLFILISAFDSMAKIKGTFAKIAYAAGVRQIVDISSGAVNQPFRSGYIGSIHRESEEAILAEKSEGHFYVALRPYRFLSNHIWTDAHTIKNSQTMNNIHGLDFKEDFISPTDIAELASVVLTEPVEKHANCVYTMIGETLTTNERAAIFTELLGKPIKGNLAPIDVFYNQLTQFGCSHPMAVDMIQKIEADGPTPYYSIMLGRSAQTLREWLQDDDNLSHFQ
ncbi:NAD(P)-binding protein [Backusella circina FSU 941]|nr:NAD(P)-binding protein [Backusella circina FSU 941]